jgi:hypothetical protein
MSTQATPKYPAVEVQLSGEDGNAFSIIGRCMKAAKRAGVPEEEIKAFAAECKSGDYDHLLQTCFKWFDVV